jgi:23S rRNA pseudouridine2605 synthase
MAPRSSERRPRRDARATGDDSNPHPGERIAKVVARAGLGSRREIEEWIGAGRVAVNGVVIASPALNVTPRDRIAVDGRDLPRPERTRLWLYHKPRGLVTTEHDPDGRPTVFESLPLTLPRVLSIGRLDITSEGLLLLTNDGGLKRILELPSTGWLRRYRVRAYGEITPDALASIAEGLEVDGVEYGPVEARIDSRTGDNTWLSVGIREGKNREVRRILEHLGLTVNRLIRVSYGPFQLGDLGEGAVDEAPTRILADQLGERLAAEAGLDFAGPRDSAPAAPRGRAARERGEERQRRREELRESGRATAKAERFARLQAGAERENDVQDDDPDVTVDPATGRITLAPKTVEDRKGRKVAVGKKFDPARAPHRGRRPRVFGEDGTEMEPRREEPRERDERPPRFRRDDDRPKRHAFRADARRAPSAEDGLRRPRRDGERSEERSGRDDRGRSFGHRDRGEDGGGPRRSFGFRDRAPDERPRGGLRARDDERGERPRQPWRPREEGRGDERPRKPRPPRVEGGEDRPRRPWKAREERRDDDRPRGGFRPRDDERGERPRKPWRPRDEGRPDERPRAPWKPRPDEAAGARPRKPWRPREDARGEERPRSGFRPREDGARERPRKPWTPRGESGPDERPRKRSGGAAEERPRKPWTPREDRGGGPPRGGFRPREDRGPPRGPGGRPPPRGRGPGGPRRPRRDD